MKEEKKNESRIRIVIFSECVVISDGIKISKYILRITTTCKFYVPCM